MLAKKIMRQGYYWPTMGRDSYAFVKKCQKFQLHSLLLVAPSSSLHSLTAPWPFSMWAFDIVGPFDVYVETRTRPAFILTATEYYTKWAEAEPCTRITTNTVVRFIMKKIISRFGVPKIFVTDNGQQFHSDEMWGLCRRFGKELHHSAPYYPPSNGKAEATNKTLIAILKKLYIPFLKRNA